MIPAGQQTSAPTEGDDVAKARDNEPIPTAPSPPPAVEPTAAATVPAVVVPLAAPKPAARRARVTIPDSHVGAIDVTIDGALTGRAADEAAKAAARAARGIISFGGGTPTVEFLD